MPQNAPAVDRRTNGYLQSYQYFFRSPGWPGNLLWASVFCVIPALGQVVLMGYQVEILKSLCGDLAATYPAFEPSRAGEYFKRGAKPGVAIGLLMIVATPIVSLAAYAVIWIPTRLEESHYTMTIFMNSLYGAAAVLLAGVVLVCVIAVPIGLRSALLNSVWAGFNPTFIRCFLARVGWRVLFDTIFVVFTGTILTTVGTLLFCIGSAPGMALPMLSQTWLIAREYHQYISRGGEPIAVGSTDVAAASAFRN